MNDTIVGYTGFVGGNIAAKHSFTHGYHSSDIQEAYGTNPELLVYSGVPAEMFLANHYPEKDMELMRDAMRNIEQINPKQVVLISSIAVYDDPYLADEDTVIDEDKLTAYGKNRRALEKYVEETYDNSLIVRLPALFGQGLKKNFIYDLIHVIPAMLTESKYQELVSQDDFIKDFYELQDNGFFKCRKVSDEEEKELKAYFRQIGFSALNFTDSRSVYQYYNLGYLWEHIEKALNLGIRSLNTATEPIASAELYKALYGTEFNNELNKVPFNYNYKTKHAEAFGGRDGYLFDKTQVTEELRQFILGKE